MNDTLSRSVIRGVDLVIVQKCGEVDTREVVPHHWLWRSVDRVEVEDLPLRADECSAYLGYLSQQYARLPRHVVFVHADAHEHVGLDRPNIIDDTLHALLRGVSIPFAHLGNNRVTMRWNPDSMSVLWRGLFGSSVVPGPTAVKTYCCSHFVVSRERVQLRSLDFYSEALRFITSPESYSYLPTTKSYAAGHD